MPSFAPATLHVLAPDGTAVPISTAMAIALAPQPCTDLPLGRSRRTLTVTFEATPAAVAAVMAVGRRVLRLASLRRQAKRKGRRGWKRLA